MSKEKTKIIYRNSKNGQITTENFAKKHPSTTEKEKVKIPKKKK